MAGGGDSAAEEALFLTRFGSSVTIVHRRDRLRASKIMAARLLSHEKVNVLWNSVVEEVLGTTHVTGLRIKNVADGTVENVGADALFVAIGHTPNTAVFAGQLDLDERGYIASPDGTSTNADGVFVAGDVNDYRYRQAVTAAGAGCRAAMDAERYLEALEFKVDSLARL